MDLVFPSHQMVEIGIWRQGGVNGLALDQNRAVALGP
jgi:hypothetical protein